MDHYGSLLADISDSPSAKKTPGRQGRWILGGQEDHGIVLLQQPSAPLKKWRPGFTRFSLAPPKHTIWKETSKCELELVLKWYLGVQLGLSHVEESNLFTPTWKNIRTELVFHTTSGANRGVAVSLGLHIFKCRYRILFWTNVSFYETFTVDVHLLSRHGWFQQLWLVFHQSFYVDFNKTHNETTGVHTENLYEIVFLPFCHQTWDANIGSLPWKRRAGEAWSWDLAMNFTINEESTIMSSPWT